MSKASSPPLVHDVGFRRRQTQAGDVGLSELQSSTTLVVRRATRAPAAVVFAAAALGIVADRYLMPPGAFWWCSFLLAGVAVVISLSRKHSFPIWLCLCAASLFAEWHHTWWADPPSDHIAALASPGGSLLTVVGTVDRPGWLRERPGEPPQRVWSLRCSGVLPHSGRVQSAPGRIQVVQDLGDRPPYPPAPLAGQEMRVTGRLFEPMSAGNPGGFDYRAWLRSQGYEATLRVPERPLIELLPSQPDLGAAFTNWRFELRNRITAQLDRSADPSTARVAEALLLGTRSQLPDDLRDAFIASGLMHVLAISGLNVAVLWLGSMRLGRALGWSFPHCAWGTLGLLVGYAWLTDANPPVIRAVTIACVLQLAALSGRNVAPLQSLSLAGLVILIRNPTDLFQPGAWLSFLAVTVLFESQRAFDHWLGRPELPPGLSWAQRAGHQVLREVGRTCVSTTAVWLATAPLLAFTFHGLSWAGLLLNVLLGPLFVVLLWLGYAWLVSLAVLPFASLLLATIFLAGLKLLIEVTLLSSTWPWAFDWVVGPPEWWVGGFYAGLLIAWLQPTLIPRRRLLQGGLVWVNLGLISGLTPTTFDGLTCDVLAVGHGLAIVMTGPSGKTLVYDAGSLAGGDVAAHAVSQDLWQARQNRIDSLLVSHADADHCNGITSLARRHSTGWLGFHSSLLDHPQSTVRQLLQAWQDSGGKLQQLHRGDVLHWDDGTTATIWLPEAGTSFASDNANSLVVLIEFAGRSVLLTGDLEKDGLRALLRQPRRAVDVLISPHHGSLAANSSELGAWTHPGWVVVSAGRTTTDRDLADRFPSDTVILNTAEVGRVRCQIFPDGSCQVSTYRQGAAP